MILCTSIYDNHKFAFVCVIFEQYLFTTNVNCLKEESMSAFVAQGLDQSLILDGQLQWMLHSARPRRPARSPLQHRGSPSLSFQECGLLTAHSCASQGCTPCLVDARLPRATPAPELTIGLAPLSTPTAPQINSHFFILAPFSPRVLTLEGTPINFLRTTPRPGSQQPVLRNHPTNACKINE